MVQRSAVAIACARARSPLVAVVNGVAPGSSHRPERDRTAAQGSQGHGTFKAGLSRSPPSRLRAGGEPATARLQPLSGCSFLPITTRRGVNRPMGPRSRLIQPAASLPAAVLACRWHRQSSVQMRKGNICCEGYWAWQRWVLWRRRTECWFKWSKGSGVGSYPRRAAPRPLAKWSKLCHGKVRMERASREMRIASSLGAYM
ncbi:hypothetical protein PSPO01_05315 [Paraphaeosphaeria sporulosa]